MSQIEVGDHGITADEWRFRSIERRLSDIESGLSRREPITEPRVFPRDLPADTRGDSATGYATGPAEFDRVKLRKGSGLRIVQIHVRADKASLDALYLDGWRTA